MTRTRRSDEAAQARADWEKRIYRRLTDTSAADESLARLRFAGLRRYHRDVQMVFQDPPH
jgi:ribosomal protein S10